MDFMKSITLCIALFALMGFMGGCSNDQRCVVQDKIVDVTSGAVAAVGQCAKPEVVKQKIEEAVSILRLCQQPTPAGEKGVIGSICALAVPPIISGVLGASFPIEAQCSAAMTKELLEAALKLACAAIPV